MIEFSFLPLRVIGQCNTHTGDWGLQTGGNMQGRGGGGGGTPI